MNSKRFLIAPCLLSVGALLLGACGPQQSVSSGDGVPGSPAGATVRAETPRASVSDARIPPPAHSKTPIKDTLEALLAAPGADSPFPQGTRLRSVSVHDRVATLDFSQEFSQLADRGDSVESEAQQMLRQTLERFPSIEKMRVTVEGHPFQSQATDWNTPFSVRSAGNDDSEGEGAEQEGGRP